MRCTATLVTATVTKCDCDPPHNLRTARLRVRVDGGEVTEHITLGRLTCMTPRGSHKTYEFLGDVYEMHQPMETRSGGLWGDDTPGATPHVAPLVTDAEIDAAYMRLQGLHGIPRVAVRRMLTAAAKARQEDNR